MRPNPRLRHLNTPTGVLLALTLVGCASVETIDAPPPPSAVAEMVTAPPAAVPVPQPVYGDFESGTLYELLVAELSLRRGDFTPALDRYAREARRTRDPGVVAKAARLATVTGDEARALTLSLLWAEVAPEDPEARHAAAVALLEAGRFEAALQQLRALRGLGGNADLTLLRLRADDVDPDAREALIRALATLQESWPDDLELSFARAVLLEKAGRFGEALTVMSAATAVGIGTEAILLRARLLESTGDPGAAVALLTSAVENGPDLGRLRYTLARLLIDIGDLDGARGQFAALLEQIGDNAEVLLSLALITLEQDRLTESRDYLARLLRTGRRPDTAHYFMGVVAERADDVAGALDAWDRVGPGFEFSRASASAARLVMETGGVADLRAHLDALRARHPDEALTLWLLEGQVLLDAERPLEAVGALSAAIDARGAQPELLYARAMAHDGAGSLEGMEADLTRILAMDPDDPMALNALGYTLADRTKRLDEARALVERAIALAPDEPAYIDSLGWVEFRDGNLESAVQLLERAFAEFPNHEVAAHLGEALWVSGDRERARTVWRAGLGLDQDTPVLQRTLERLLTEDERRALEDGADGAGSPDARRAVDAPVVIAS